MRHISKVNQDPITKTFPSKSIANSASKQSSHGLGNDMVTLSKEFAKGTSSGSSVALSNAKETAKVDQKRQKDEKRQSDSDKRVNSAKAVASSQVDSRIKKQRRGQYTPRKIKTCEACKGVGCPNCKPELAELFTIEEQQKLHKINKALGAVENPIPKTVHRKVQPIKKSLNPSKDRPNQENPGINTYADKVFI